MEYKGCYDSVAEIILEAGKKFQSIRTMPDSSRYTYILDSARFDELGEICAEVDALVEEVDCSFVEVSVEEERRRLTIDIGCDEIICHHDTPSVFYTLIKRVDCFSFSKTTKGGLCITLNIDNLWRKAWIKKDEKNFKQL